MRRFMLCVAVLAGLFGSLLAAPANATYIGREGKIAFVRANQIYTVANSGGIVTKLTNSGKNYRPHWSPTGRRLAYIHETAAGARDVWVMSATGTGKTAVTTTGDVTAPAIWSPDGTVLAFAAGPKDSQMYVIPSTPPFGPRTAVTAYSANYGETINVLVDRFMAWSPDGGTINYFNNDSESSPDHAIHSMTVPTNLAGGLGGVETVINGTGGSCCGFVEWSDLVFGPTGEFGYGEVNTGLNDGTTPYVKIVYPGFVWQQGDRSPTPSPSNVHMAFTRSRSGVSNIYVSTITGALRHRIVTNGYTPDWQPLP
jgi:Tol biopolymer transport system component